MGQHQLTYEVLGLDDTTAAQPERTNHLLHLVRVRVRFRAWVRVRVGFSDEVRVSAPPVRPRGPAPP